MMTLLVTVISTTVVLVKNHLSVSQLLEACDHELSLKFYSCIHIPREIYLLYMVKNPPARCVW